jgi:hypothetical protein
MGNKALFLGILAKTTAAVIWHLVREWMVAAGADGRWNKASA